MLSTYGSQSRNRPLGVTILCVLGALGVLDSLFGSLGVTGHGGLGFLVGLVTLALALGRAAVLYGLWHLRYWAYKWSMIIYVLSAVLSLIALQLLELVIDVLILAYLASKAEYFE